MRTDRDIAEGWARLQKQFDPERIAKRLKVILPIAHKQVGERFVAIATDKIDAREYEPNSALTVALKGSDLPLVGADSQLRGSITYKVAKYNEVQFGSKSPKLPGGRLLYDVLHEGYIMKVTPRMRAAVMAKLNEDRKGILALKKKSKKRKKQLEWIDQARAALSGFGGPGPAYWTIPARPYLETVWLDPEWRALAQRTYHDAMVEILRAPKSAASE